MTLPAPKLDTRTFDDLVREARARIPRYTPEWTNLNDSDPGMTLVKLHAWLTETILFELNRVPDLSYVKFLDLLGITPLAAQPARTDLTFELHPLGAATDPLTVPVPRNAKVAVDDPELPHEVVFETDRTLLALNAHVGAVIAASNDEQRPRALVTRYDAGTVWLHSFPPVDPELASGSAMYVGLLLRPNAKPPLDAYADDRLPAGPLGLFVDAVQVHDEGPDGSLVEGPLTHRCAQPSDAADAARHIAWQLHTGDSAGVDHFVGECDTSHWTDVALSADETLGLVRSGHVVLELPSGATPLSPVRLAPGVWADLGQLKPPQTPQELVEALESAPHILPGLAPFWEAMGVDDPDDVLAFAACAESVPDTVAKIEALPEGELRPAQLTQDDWIAVHEEFSVDLPQMTGDLRPLHWLRARVVPHIEGGEPRPADLRALHLNTVPATQAATRLDDSLGRSTGRPAQSFSLPETPVLVDPATGVADLTLQVGDDQEPWEQRVDFFRSGPDDPHYLLDPDAGTITLGDGLRGRIPVAGAQVTATRYRTGGGLVGNVPAGTISRIKGRLRHVAGATNIRASHDGTDAEPLEEVKLRAPHELRVRERAVSAQDFADLALRTPSVALHRAHALARRAVEGDDLVERDGAVTVVVLPYDDHAAPQPSESQLRAICRWLEPRRLLTTELHVTGPRYTTVLRLAASLTVDPDHDLTAVTDAVYDALVTYLHPLRGGRSGNGWGFGEDIYHGDLYDVMLAVEGVGRVRGLTLELPDDTSQDSDVATVAQGHLPVLTRDALDIGSSYA